MNLAWGINIFQVNLHILDSCLEIGWWFSKSFHQLFTKFIQKTTDHKIHDGIVFVINPRIFSQAAATWLIDSFRAIISQPFIVSSWNLVHQTHYHKCHGCLGGGGVVVLPCIFKEAVTTWLRLADGFLALTSRQFNRSSRNSYTRLVTWHLVRDTYWGRCTPVIWLVDGLLAIYIHTAHSLP